MADRRPAIFFDRDGVINRDDGYVFRATDFVWIDGAIEAISLFNRLGYATVLITNQSGIARGLYTEADFQALTQWIGSELTGHGAHFDAVYFCPHHPEASVREYRIQCECRKPRPGMLLRAIRELSIDVAASALIGDKFTDCEAAEAAGVRSYMFEGGNLLDFAQRVLAIERQLSVC